MSNNPFLQGLRKKEKKNSKKKKTIILYKLIFTNQIYLAVAIGFLFKSTKRC